MTKNHYFLYEKSSLATSGALTLRRQYHVLNETVSRHKQRVINTLIKIIFETSGRWQLKRLHSELPTRSQHLTKVSVISPVTVEV